MRKARLIIPLILFSAGLASCFPFIVPPGEKLSVPAPTISGLLLSGYNFSTNGEDHVVHQAENLSEASDAIGLAIVNHYDAVRIRFAFNNDVDAATFRTYYIPIDGHVTTVVDVYHTGYDRENRFVFHYLGNGLGAYEIASRRTAPTARNTFRDVINANQLIRYAHMAKRPDDFEDFPIDKINRGTMPVINSEELWWVVGKGYKPVFPVRRTKAEAIYVAARDVLRAIVNDEMDGFEKTRVIYEWIVSQNRYDHDAVDDTVPWVENVAYFLEGVFQYHAGVCDAFSKTFVLLGGIENLDVMRAYGYAGAKSEDEPEGHAWNYASPKDNGIYYLVCPTWGQIEHSVGGVNMSLCDYVPFLTSKTYFYDQSKGEFSFTQRGYDSGIFSTAPYSPSVWELDVLPTDVACDCKIDSSEEMSAFVEEAVKEAAGRTFSIEFQDGGFGKDEMVRMFRSALERHGNRKYSKFYQGVSELYGIVTDLFIVT